MTDEVQPAKRRRTSQEAESVHEADRKSTRSNKFWFEDGTIMLEAESIQYCVHGSVLSMHSPVFADMLAMPQPSDAPSVDGRPLVELHDTAEDINNLLELIYTTLRVNSHRRKTSMTVCATMLRLGRKYQFNDLLAEGHHLLSTEFPFLIEDWNKLRWYRNIKPSPGNLVEAVYLAHENRVFSVLPAIYVRLCLVYSIEDIRIGFGEFSHQNHLLVTDEPVSFLHGRELLYRTVPETTLAWLQGTVIPCSLCQLPRSCRGAKDSLIKELWTMELCAVIKFAVYPWHRNPMLQGKLCSPCGAMAKELYEGTRNTLWLAIPKFFGLNQDDPHWKENQDVTPEAEESMSTVNE